MQNTTDWHRSGPVLSAIFILAFLLAESCFCQTFEGQRAREFHGTVTREAQIKYLLFLPEGYNGNTDKRWPLIMYLHGGSRRGTDIEKLREPGYGLPALVEKNKSFPFIVLSPQCPEGEYWTDTDDLIALLDEVLKNYAADPRRVYLTGHSMGGRGTWYLAYEHPEKFAAIAPMSGLFLSTAWASRLKHMPIWAFHGEKDDIAPISDTVELLKALRDAGNKDVRFTALPDRDHFILDEYENQALYSWFLEHKLNDGPTSTGVER
jgi:predicted peptidase